MINTEFRRVATPEGEAMLWDRKEVYRRLKFTFMIHTNTLVYIKYYIKCNKNSFSKNKLFK